MDLQNLAGTPSPYQDIESFSDFPFSGSGDLALSLNRGDKVTYYEGEEVVVNVLKAGYSILKVFKNDSLVPACHIHDASDVRLSDLSAGQYQATLFGSDDEVSNSVSFEILQTNVSVSHGIRGFVDIRFSSENGVPEYIVFCNESGGRYLIDSITEEERQAGQKFIKYEAKTRSLYVKVFFRGEFGRVSNAMIPIG